MSGLENLTGWRAAGFFAGIYTAVAIGVSLLALLVAHLRGVM